MLLSIGPLSQTSSSSGMQMRKCRRDADGEEQLFAREIFFVPDFLYGSANISKILGPPNSDGDGQTENKASCESSMSALTGICTPARPFCCEQDTSIITTRINLAKIRSALSISFPTKPTVHTSHDRAKIVFSVICSFFRCLYFTSSIFLLVRPPIQPCPRLKIVRLDLPLLLSSPTARAPATVATVTAMMTSPSLRLLHPRIRTHPLPSRVLQPAAMPLSCRPIPKATVGVTSRELALPRHLLLLLVLRN